MIKAVFVRILLEKLAAQAYLKKAPAAQYHFANARHTKKNAATEKTFTGTTPAETKKNSLMIVITQAEQFVQMITTKQHALALIVTQH